MDVTLVEVVAAGFQLLRYLVFAIMLLHYMLQLCFSHRGKTPGSKVAAKQLLGWVFCNHAWRIGPHTLSVYHISGQPLHSLQHPSITQVIGCEKALTGMGPRGVDHVHKHTEPPGCSGLDIEPAHRLGHDCCHHPGRGSKRPAW